MGAESLLLTMVNIAGLLSEQCKTRRNEKYGNLEDVSEPETYLGELLHERAIQHLQGSLCR